MVAAEVSQASGNISSSAKVVASRLPRFTSASAPSPLKESKKPSPPKTPNQKMENSVGTRMTPKRNSLIFCSVETRPNLIWTSILLTRMKPMFLTISSFVWRSRLKTRQLFTSS